MPVFQIQNKKLNRLKEKKFDLEKDLQILTEENLEEIFGLQFVSGKLNKQFIVHNFEIDTLGFDTQTNSFVIIEYKKDQSFSIIDQGFNYLSLMVNNKAEFILEYNEKLKANLKKDDIDWGQSRVYFIAPSFTPHQRGAISFKDLPIELWEVSLFENNLVLFNRIKVPEAVESIKKVSKSQTVTEVSKEIKTFVLEDHLSRGNSDIQGLLHKLRSRIFEIDNRVQENPTQNYLGYRLSWYNFASVHVFREKLKVYVRKSNLENDPKKLFKKIPDSYKWGKTPLWWIDIFNEEAMDYVLSVVRESYEAAPDK